MLPKPNVEYADNKTEKWTNENVGGMLCNPVYAGIGEFPPIVSDELWVAAAKRLVDEWGIEQFFVNMLYCLRMSLGNTFDPENTPTLKNSEEQI